MSGLLPAAASTAREKDDEESIWWPASPPPPLPVLFQDTCTNRGGHPPDLCAGRGEPVNCGVLLVNTWLLTTPIPTSTPRQGLFSTLAYTKGAQGSDLEEKAMISILASSLIDT